MRDERLPFQTDPWFSPTFRVARPDVVSHVCDVFRSTRPLVHAQACRALGQFDLRDELATIRAQTLVATGEEDHATPPVMGEALARDIPGAPFMLWPTVRHIALLESAALQRFVPW
jgi:3-oxoadipate enol-lactonase